MPLTGPLANSRVHVIDSHTAGEPTRTIVSGGPTLAGNCWSEKRDDFARRWDGFRRSVLSEPRGNEVLVGAFIGDPIDSANTAGVVFFNNVGVLHMCGHGLIGVVVTLAHQQSISPGRHVFETSAGNVDVELADDFHTVTIKNVPSFRHAKDVTLVDSSGAPARLDDGSVVRGDVAWGGNWFFLMHRDADTLCVANRNQLIDQASQVRDLIRSNELFGPDGGVIDHVEFHGDSVNGQADSRGFVLCPGGQWDRSPCGTGTSAMLACLAADGRLAPGERWRHESILESNFDAHYEAANDQSIIPSITGSAWITATSELHFHPDDPFVEGISYR